MRVGVLALQGDVSEHESALRRVGAVPGRVRRPADLEQLDALILPGGESTTIGQLVTEFGLLSPLRAFVASGRPVWGTCAGMILLAESAGREQPLLGGLDVVVERNHFGRQVDSFEADLHIAGLAGEPFHGVFIRAPAVASAGPSVAVLARLDDGTIVAVQQGSLLATAFHPELTGDDRLHRLFLALDTPALAV
jgi:5'-phosphate synthase pdxT subunit